MPTTLNLNRDPLKSVALEVRFIRAIRGYYDLGIRYRVPELRGIHRDTGVANEDLWLCRSESLRAILHSMGCLVICQETLSGCR